MQVFISWSGARSHAVADLLDEWIQCVLQAIRPWMSSKDIDRGSLWFSEITNQLKDTKIGIVCLTKDNINKPWILFEAGALAKGLSSNRVCTLLVDLDSTDVRDPLAQFNHTRPDKEGIYSLVRTLNSSLGDQALNDKVLDQVFETYWPQFKRRFGDALDKHPQGEHAPPRSDESMLSEMLSTVRAMDRRIRSLEHAGAFRDPRQWDHLTLDQMRDLVARTIATGSISPEALIRLLGLDAPAKSAKSVSAELTSTYNLGDEDGGGIAKGD